MTIEKKGVFLWDAIIVALKKADPHCGIEGYDGDEIFLHRMVVKPSSPDKATALETVLNNHDAEAALAAETAKKERMAKAPVELFKLQKLAGKTAEEIRQWHEANVNDQEGLKQVQQEILVGIRLLMDKEGIL